MPERNKHFTQAENDRYDVSNVLRDNPRHTPTSEPSKNQESLPDINLEEGAPFIESIDPEATIGEYMARYQEDEEEEILDEQKETQEIPEPVDASQTPADASDDAPQDTLQHPAIREQAEKARATFIDDLHALASEPGIVSDTTESDDKSYVEDTLYSDDAPYVDGDPENDDGSYGEDTLYDDNDPDMNADLDSDDPYVDDQPYSDDEPYIDDNVEYDPAYSQDEDDEDDGPEPITFKDLLRPAARRIKKPRFVQPGEPDPQPLEQEQEPDSDPQDDQTSDHDILQMHPDTPESDQDPLDQDLAEARAAQKKGHSICEDLHHLQHHLEESRSPFLHKTEVLVPRERTLRLVRALTAICDIDPSYIDSASEDKLIDRLISENSDDDYRPLERACSRAQTIIADATRQADTILNDAKTLARQLLAETEAEIKEKYDAADQQIAVRMTTTKEESTKNLNAARSELTTSRKRSVEILSKYLEKAENDYQGYWERAENTVMASLEQSASILDKAADIYRKELITIHQDKEELDEILQHLKKYKTHHRR